MPNQGEGAWHSYQAAKMVGIRVIAASLVVVALLIKGQFVSALLLGVVIALLQALFGSDTETPASSVHNDTRTFESNPVF
jgi:hypothetical protein